MADKLLKSDANGGYIGPVETLLSIDGNLITGVGTPTEDTGAANKAYVDSNISGLPVKQVTTTLTLSQVQNLVATPVDVVPSEGEDATIVPIHAVVKIVGGASALVYDSNSFDLQLQYNGGENCTYGSNSQAGCQVGEGIVGLVGLQPFAYSLSDAANKGAAVQIKKGGGVEISGGDANTVFSVITTYIVV